MENWDPTEYQGRTKKQVETNEKIMGIVLTAFIIFSAVSLILKFLI